jgi:hypothetical protein
MGSNTFSISSNANPNPTDPASTSANLQVHKPTWRRLQKKGRVSYCFSSANTWWPKHFRHGCCYGLLKPQHAALFPPVSPFLLSLRPGTGAFRQTTNACGRRALFGLAALSGGSGMRSRTNPTGPVRATLPEPCRPRLAPDLAKTINRPALTSRPDRQPRQRSPVRAFAFGEGLWNKVRMDHSRRGGCGVKIGSGRTPKDPILRPRPTGGRASRSVTNSPKNFPDARFCRAGAGGLEARG